MSTARPTVVVTGGTRRVGRAIALAFARAGCDLHITYRTSQDEAGEVLRLCRDLGVSASASQFDLNDLQSVGSAGEVLAGSVSRVDVLVHNASIYQPTPLDSFDAASALAHYRINALGPALLSQALVPMLGRSSLPGGGAIVAMCDIHALGLPRPDFLAYSMSKAALAELVRTLAVALAPEVRVNGVAPGVVAWPEDGPESDEAAQARYLRRVPLSRAGTPEEAAETVRWLALEATYLTGQIIRVDGGRWLR